MESKPITRINGIDIPAVVENGETYLPIKPICQAIGVNYATQLEKLKSHPILSSVIPLRGTTGADGKKYEMVCLPLKFIYGWLFTINPGNVSEEARENVIKYQIECYDVLYRHFFNRAERQAESNKAEVEELERLRQLIVQEKEVKSQINETKKRIDSIRASRLDDHPALF